MKGNDMTKYTTTSLIKELEKFTEDLPIETELAMVYNYDDDKVLAESRDTYEDIQDVFDDYAKHATELAIFEGSWEEDYEQKRNKVAEKFIIQKTLKEDGIGENRANILAEEIMDKLKQGGVIK